LKKVARKSTGILLTEIKRNTPIENKKRVLLKTGRVLFLG